MNRTSRVQLFGGPMDGALMSVKMVNGKLPTSVNVRVPITEPIFPETEDGPYPVRQSRSRTVVYVRDGQPRRGLLPTYRMRPT